MDGALNGVGAHGGGRHTVPGQLVHAELLERRLSLTLLTPIMPVNVHLALEPAMGRTLCAAFGETAVRAPSDDGHRDPPPLFASVVAACVVRCTVAGGGHPICLLLRWGACASFRLRVVARDVTRELELTVVEVVALLMARRMPVLVELDLGVDGSAVHDWDDALHRLLDDGRDAP